MSKIIKVDFNSSLITFNSDGWINATEVANAYGKRLDHWLANKSTQEYIAACGEEKYTNLIRTRRGKNGGTWLHPKLVIRFAQWLDTGFAIWCQENSFLFDEEVNHILNSNAKTPF